ncbi:MAG: hypothetical protein R3E40_05240 [Rhodocyclaceae bacterium]
MSWFFGTPAMRPASASTAASSSAAGTASDQPHRLGGAAVDQVAGEQHALGFLGADAVYPHRRGRAAPDARRRIADLRVLGHDDDVGAQRDVAAAGHRIAMHLADHRLVGAPQREEVVGAALHEAVVHHRVPRHGLYAGVLAFGLGEILQVVTRTETAPSAGEDDDVDGVVGVGLFHRGADLAGHLLADGVEPLGPVEGDAGDAPGGFVAQGLESHCLLRGHEHGE